MACLQGRAMADTRADNLLEIEGLTKRFGGVVASDAITLEVPNGELHAVIGPNDDPMPPSTTMTMRSPERVQCIVAGLMNPV